MGRTEQLVLRLDQIGRQACSVDAVHKALEGIGGQAEAIRYRQPAAGQLAEVRRLAAGAVDVVAPDLIEPQPELLGPPHRQVKTAAAAAYSRETLRVFSQLTGDTRAVRKLTERIDLWVAAAVAAAAGIR